MFTFFKELFRGKPFDFYTEYTLRETYQHLIKKSQHTTIWSRLLRNWRHLGEIELEPVSADKFRFKCTRDAGNHMWVIAYGIVEKDPYGVHVAGKVEMGRLTQFLMLIDVIVVVGLGIVKLVIPTIAKGIISVPFSMILLVIGLAFLLRLYTQINLYLNIHKTLYLPQSR